MGFVEASLRANITDRQLQNEFLARGMAGRDEARRTGRYFSSSEVLDAVLQAKWGERT